VEGSSATELFFAVFLYFLSVLLKDCRLAIVEKEILFFIDGILAAFSKCRDEKRRKYDGLYYDFVVGANVFWDYHRSVFLEPFAEPKDEPQRSGPGIPQGTG
jgi:hypothetical protein